ncbi:HAD-IA family hydrolase [Streptomyces sp. SID5785]|uniref:HAD family hydrolase n=1 Tax=Streptomyces sp. SID5785 TaxID=2690309 RepID=UPI00136135EF|nr:HAD family hydrolase [Streptomyces sp. SID5785]MZD08211.1 HAD-IA family hydrolase [Streptomyces sp. SID5785]
MPLLMLDLDNTLVDRDAAFHAAVAEFLAGHGLPPTDLSWVAALDAGGYARREEVAAGMTQRYGRSIPISAIRTLLDTGAADRVELADSTRTALEAARADGWSCVIVTNGRTAQQEAKIRRTGLDRLVRTWVISEAVGHKKPAPEIFRAAASTVGLPLRGSWVIGDSPHADIGGADALGLRSVWVSADRPWTEAAYRPTHIAANVDSALACVIGTPPR